MNICVYTFMIFTIFLIIGVVLSWIVILVNACEEDAMERLERIQMMNQYKRNQQIVNQCMRNNQQLLKQNIYDL